MTRVAVSGAGGKLASPIIEAVASAHDLELSGLYNPHRAGQVIDGVEVTGNTAAISADVVIETAHPDLVFPNLGAWRDLGAAAVVGTSGFTPERLEKLRGLWGTDRPCLVVPNFAIGAVLMMKFAAEAAQHFDATEVIERHHSTKPDAPSGTALATAMGISEGKGSSVDHGTELVIGARGADVQGVRVHAVRLPGLISHQEVVMSNNGELFSIEHMSTSYDSFASGAVLAAQRVQSLPGGVHVGLAAVL